MRVEPAVTVPARRNWFMLLFFIAWLGGWTVGGVTALSQLLRPGDHRAFLSFWLVGWVLGELFALSVALWQLFGREELLVSSGGLQHRVVAAGLSRTREYAAADIKHLRAPPQAFPPFFDQAAAFPPIFGAGFGSISFDYGAKTYRVGAGLDEAEARLVLAEIRKYFPRMAEGAP